MLTEHNVDAQKVSSDSEGSGVIFWVFVSGGFIILLVLMAVLFHMVD